MCVDNIKVGNEYKKKYFELNKFLLQKGFTLMIGYSLTQFGS